MKRLIIGAMLLGMNGCANFQEIGFVPWSQAAARFQQTYNACHEDKPCREKAWADYHAELAASSSRGGLDDRFNYLLLGSGLILASCHRYRSLSFGAISILVRT